jgi:hypothetical protein
MNMFRLFISLASAVVFALPITANAELSEWACKSGQWIVHDFDSQGHCVSAVTSGDALVWNNYTDFRFHPDHRNPSPDQHGNEDVWHYGYSIGLEHNPANYVWSTDFMMVDEFDAWVATNNNIPAYPPYVGADPSGDDEGGFQFVPTATNLALVGWRSPVEGHINISGEIGERNPSCGDGVIGSVERLTASGVIKLVQIPVNRPTDEVGQYANYAIRLRVSVGDFVYFIIDPGNSSECDIAGSLFTIVHRPGW